MIDLYAIINEGKTMEMYVRDGSNRAKLESLLTLIVKKIGTNIPSKIIKTTTQCSYHIYYFGQASFVFVLFTLVTERVPRMQNHLRVVADIFYENYDERKFHYILDRIMDEINRIEFGAKSKDYSLEDEESQLVCGDTVAGKMQLNNIMRQRQRQSRRAYIVMTVLFFAIMALGIFYLKRRWN